MSVPWFFQFLSSIFKPHFNTLVFSSHSSLPADLHKIIWNDSAVLHHPICIISVPTLLYLVTEFRLWLISFVRSSSFSYQYSLKKFPSICKNTQSVIHHFHSCCWQYAGLNMIVDLWNPCKSIPWIYALNGIRLALVSSEDANYWCFPCLLGFPFFTLQFHRYDKDISNLQSKVIWTVNCTTIKKSPTSCK